MPKSPKQAAIAKVLGESRWRILGELCRLPQTASELATRVSTSANAVRVHLDALEEAGLVGFEVERRQVGKPTHVYSLTAAAEALLSKAYVPTLDAILSVARDQGDGASVPLLRKAGVALAETLGDSLPGPRGLPAAQRMLEKLGAITTVEREDGHIVLQTTCCPLGALTGEDACVILESAVRSASGVAARQRCARANRSICRFEFVT